VSLAVTGITTSLGRIVLVKSFYFYLIFLLDRSSGAGSVRSPTEVDAGPVFQRADVVAAPLRAAAIGRASQQPSLIRHAAGGQPGVPARRRRRPRRRRCEQTSPGKPGVHVTNLGNVFVEKMQKKVADSESKCSVYSEDTK
jgi:hypothetical protein